MFHIQFLHVCQLAWKMPKNNVIWVGKIPQASAFWPDVNSTASGHQTICLAYPQYWLQYLQGQDPLLTREHHLSSLLGLVHTPSPRFQVVGTREWHSTSLYVDQPSNNSQGVLQLPLVGSAASAKYTVHLQPTGGGQQLGSLSQVLGTPLALGSKGCGSPAHAI